MSLGPNNDSVFGDQQSKNGLESLAQSVVSTSYSLLSMMFSDFCSHQMKVRGALSNPQERVLNMPMRSVSVAVALAFMMGIGTLAILMAVGIRILPPFAALSFPGTAPIDLVSPTLVPMGNLR